MCCAPIQSYSLQSNGPEAARISLGRSRISVTTKRSAAGDPHRLHPPGLVHPTLCVSFPRASHNSVEPWERGRRVKACPSIIGMLAFAGAVAFGCPTSAAEPDSEQAGQSKFRDPDDGKLDLSAFLASAYGFVPLLVPITDPAVGYGAVAAAVFVHGEPPAEGEPFVRPTISAVGGLSTENGTRGWFGANLGTWRGGRVRTIAALADMDVNLEFFGLGGDAATTTQGLGYSVKARGRRRRQLSARRHPALDGAAYTAVDTRVSLEPSVVELPNVPLDDYDLRLGALTPSLTLDRRDNFFTPIRGWYVDLSVPMYRESLGSDRDFETANLTGMYFRPFAESLFLSLRGSGKYSSDRTPFFLRPYIRCAECRRFSIRASERLSLKRSSVGNSAHAGASSVSSAQAKPVAPLPYESPRRTYRRSEPDFGT